MNKAQSDPVEEESPFDSDEVNTNRKVQSEEEQKDPPDLMASDRDKGGSLSMVAAQILIYTFGLNEPKRRDDHTSQILNIAPPKRFANLLSSQDYESELCKSSSETLGRCLLEQKKKKETSGSSHP